MGRPPAGYLMAPLKLLVPTSPFGFRVSPLSGLAGDFHLGQDYSAPCGTAVYAADSGVVRAAGWHPWGGGNRVEIDHGNGLITTYNHLESIAVRSGDSVKVGQAIARVGTTGWSTGCHLHFETILNGRHTSPLKWRLMAVHAFVAGPAESLTYLPGIGAPSIGPLRWTIPVGLGSEAPSAAPWANLPTRAAASSSPMSPLLIAAGDTGPGTPTTSPSEPGTVSPSPSEPGTASPSPSEPGTASPSEPGTASPSPSEPGTASPSPSEPGTASPSPSEPGTVSPSPSEPGTVSPSPTEPIPAEPAPTEPVPAPVEPAPVEPAPAPVEPAPVEPAPAPVEPAPVEPAPAPVEPAPVEPAPTPVEPAPVEPAPTEPAPIAPAPTEPMPAPVEPAPTEPSPTDPAPSVTDTSASLAP
ncbi:peptidoglycan DD-metalloendopeptidase family protein [Pseudarthrobacter sp. L1SW]|nr:peptidoglycan DD-metalloendopeptidase family protein [Pseudarthrobacter sp. L1SW]